MIVRYSDTPVGPYDELVIIPGAYTYPVQNEKGKWVEKENPRVTRIYVSQKHTLYNGRYNWNIPKHLARFEWIDLPNGAKRVKVFPSDESSEASGTPIPLLQASFKAIPFVPAFPLSTTWFEKLGVETAIVQPPLPQGVSKEAVGTEQWCRCPLTQYSPKTHLGWFDLRQRDEQGKLTGLFENFWPGMGRWQLGVRMDHAELVIPEGQHWHSPKTNI
ncbi:hypothetical protein VM1G_02306 [Cytospora mali]|uniref:Uncharacterized protein n=1 Tax=Cytospora mali TaxID=578113 RepID=A0A194VRK8_CYTMA|nr:hypothetical protein VM1G_02306 [Valsa mali]